MRAMQHVARHDPMDVVRSTFAGLAAPRRLVPILVVAVPIIFTQAQNPDPYALPLGVTMVLAFLGIAPASYRLLFTGTQTSPVLLRIGIYIAIAASVLYVLGTVVPRLVDLRTSFLTYDTSLLVSLGLFLVGGFGLGRDIATELELSRARARAEALEREAEHAQLLAIRTHLDPHFLFNTLNAIAEWCRDDGIAAERAILELASMLRTMLDSVRTPSWPLARDLELAEALGRLYGARDAERFVFVAHIDPAARAREVPAMITLPLIENAWKHGPSRGHAGPVSLVVEAKPRATVIRVENQGAYAGPREGGEGLAMVTRRLESAYGGEARFTIDGAGGRTIATLTLPHSARSEA